MSLDEAELMTAELLERSGFTIERFTKEKCQNRKTPDFKVLRNGGLVFYCEVKSGNDIWLDAQLEKAKPGEIVGGLRADPIFNRLTKDVHTATQQLCSVNPGHKIPNVISLVNFDRMAGVLDLIAVTTGNFMAEDGPHPIYRQYSDGRMKSDLAAIDLILWLEQGKHPKRFFTRSNEAHTSTICRYFGIVESDIRNIP